MKGASDRRPVVGVLEVDGRGALVEVVPWWASALGPLPSDPVGQPWWMLLPGEERAGAAEAWTSAAAAGVPFSQALHVADEAGCRRDLVVCWLRSGGDTAGHAGWVGGFLDVTEQGAVEAHLCRSQKLDAIGRVTGRLRHDLNNTLSVVLTNAGLLLRVPGAMDEDQREMVSDIEQAARSGVELLKRLRSFGRRADLASTPLDLAVAVREAAPSGTDLDLCLPKPGPTVSADPRAVERILAHLVNNARDAMPGGGPVRVEVDEIQAGDTLAGEFLWIEPGRWGRITVADHGVGMDADTLERIFEPFFTTKERGKGDGLGLATVYGMMRQHGGHVDVRSEPGKGTTVRLYFPVPELTARPNASEFAG